MLLLHSSSDLRLQEDSCGSIPLFCAIESGNNNVCKELLSSNAEKQVRITGHKLNGAEGSKTIFSGDFSIETEGYEDFRSYNLYCTN